MEEHFCVQQFNELVWRLCLRNCLLPYRAVGRKASEPHGRLHCLSRGLKDHLWSLRIFSLVPKEVGVHRLEADDAVEALFLDA